MPSLTPQRLYVGTQAALAVLLSTAQTTYGLYAVKTAGLGPLELALVGTALELSIAVAEVPTGVVADVYSRRLSVIIGLVVIGAGVVTMGTVPRGARRRQRPDGDRLHLHQRRAPSLARR